MAPMDIYFTVKTLHIISATVLFGTGMGTAFFMYMSRFSDDMAAKFYAARTTVLADYIFTTPAVIIQPLSGAWLVWQGSYGVVDAWLVWTYGLYALAGASWLPVVWLQIRMKRMLAAAMISGDDLPPEYDRYFRIWFWLGWPAFGGLVAVFFLMVAKPV